jgi:hypothetical protein
MRSKLAYHTKRPQEGGGSGVALIYYFTSPKTLTFHIRQKPLLVNELVIRV